MTDRPPDEGLVRTGSHWGMWTAELRDGAVARAIPFEHDPEPSDLLKALPPMLDHATRIKQPMVRSGYLRRRDRSDRSARGQEPFVPVGWNAALEIVADEIERIRAQFGSGAIYPGSGWASAGRLHIPKTLLSRFLNLFGGSIETVTNYSFGAASVIVPQIVGTMAPVVGPISSWPEIEENTELFVAFGGVPLKNLQINQGGLGQHDATSWLRRLAAKGIEFVYFGPQREDVGAELNAAWLPSKPGTDTAVMLGMAHTLAVEGLVAARFLSENCNGYDRFLAYVLGKTDGQPKSPEWAAEISGVEPQKLRDLARRMARQRTMLAASWSIQRADNGEQPYWALITLAAMLGQIGLPGGGFGFGYGAINGLAARRRSLPLPTMPTGANPVDVAVPVARMTDMLMNPGGSYDFNGKHLRYPDVRLMFWCGGNAFHQQQDLNRLVKAWSRPETIVAHESWWTPTARRADIVLPVATTVERNDIGASAFDRYWFAMKRAIDPVGQSRNEFDIFSELAERLGNHEGFTENLDEMSWLRRMFDAACEKAQRLGVNVPSFDEFWDRGYLEFSSPPSPAVPFAEFRRDPKGHPLKTPSGKIEIFSERIASYGYARQPGHAVWIEPAEWLGAPLAERFPLHLLSNQPKARLHSQLDPGPVSRASKVQGREAIKINPDDASARDIADGAVVRVFNDRGACLAGAVLCPTLMRGVVQMATGAWFDPVTVPGVGALDAHGSVNVLTRDKGTSPLAQCSTAQTCLVEVERYDGPLPELTVLAPPPIATEEAGSGG